MQYRCNFDRIGRNKAVAPLTAEADDADALAESVFAYANPKLMSRDVDVSVDLEKMTGTIFAGFHVAGSFTIDVIPA